MLQPLDVGVFGPVKMWVELFEAVEAGVQGDDCFKGGISRIRRTALAITSTQCTCISGFRASGAYSLPRMLCSVNCPPPRSSDFLTLYHNAAKKTWNTSPVQVAVNLKGYFRGVLK